MSTLFYSPAVRIIIESRRGIIDVTDDIASGSLNLASNAPHKLQFTLTNTRRKYDGIFMPNDRIVCRLKRLRWLQCFAGYLDVVPFFSAYPREINLEASCTLKRLQMTYWDPGTSAVADLLNSLTAQVDTPGLSSDANAISGNLTGKAKTVLTQIAKWPESAIHMGSIPLDWINRVEQIGAQLTPIYTQGLNLIGADPVVGGSSASERGTITDPAGSGTGWGSLPANQGKVRVNNDEPTNFPMELSRESRTSPNDIYWCAMRVNLAARTHWVNKSILVINPANGRALVLRLADWGPHQEGYAIAVSPGAAAALGVTGGDTVSIRYASDGAIVGSDGRTGAGSGVATGPLDRTTTTTPGMQPAGNMAGLTWAPADGLVANVRAARDFTLSSWSGIKAVYGYATSGHAEHSDHYTGHALDFVVSSGAATGDAKALGNSIAMWYASNPHVFGVKQIIWYDRINNGAGWGPYNSGSPSDDSLQHRNHVHVSFYDQAQAGNPGSPWPGADPSNFTGGFSASGPAGTAQLLQASGWVWGIDPESEILSGERALLNDVPIYPAIQELIHTSMREFCAAPNGDLIAWFPDYFGIYGLAAVMSVHNIELHDFTMDWTDQYLVTHQFTAGSYSGYGSPEAQTEMTIRKATTMGIATVEHEAILRALLNVSDEVASGWLNPAAILQRFGARPNFQPMEAITSPEGEFWYALHLLQQNWANQFSANVPITWMPELFPGMLLRLEDYGVQFYIDNVRHSWDLSTNGGGFQTSAHVGAPSSVSGRGFAALPRGA